MFLLTIQIEDVRESHQAILERATATGLLSGNGQRYTAGDNPDTVQGAGDKPHKSDSSTSNKGRKTAKTKKISPAASKNKKLKKSATSKRVAFGTTSRDNLLDGSKSAK